MLCGGRWQRSERGTVPGRRWAVTTNWPAAGRLLSWLAGDVSNACASPLLTHFGSYLILATSPKLLTRYYICQLPLHCDSLAGR